MNLRLVAALASLGCAAETLPATPLAGPYPTIDAACAAALHASGTPPRRCASTRVAPSGAPFSAVLLRAEDRSDPRFSGSGAFFLAIRSEGSWYVAPKPIDRMNGAAGHMYLPEITPTSARAVDGRVLLRFVDATSRVCNVCEGPARRRRTPVQTRAVVMVCGRDRADAIACTAPMKIDAEARAELTAEGRLAIRAPGGAATKVYDVVF